MTFLGLVSHLNMINKPKEEEGTIQKTSPRIVTKIAAREI